MNGKTPSTMTIVRTDGWSSFLATVVVLSLFVFLYEILRDGVINHKVIEELLCGGIGFSILFWRITRIKELFQNGTEVQGTVTKIKSLSDKSEAWIFYNYTYQDKEYEKRTLVLVVLNKEAERLHQGKSITVLVDFSRPKRSAIKDIYLI